jgi:hypothetical protein
MADQKDVRAIPCIAVNGDLDRNKIIHKAIEVCKQFREFGFHEMRYAFRIGLEESPPRLFLATPRNWYRAYFRFGTRFSGSA